MVQAINPLDPRLMMQARMLGAQQGATEAQAMQQPIQELGNLMNAFDRRSILNQLSQPELQTPVAQRPTEIAVDTEERLLTAGGLVDESKQAEFMMDTEKLASPEVSQSEMVAELEKRKAKLESQGRDSKDTQELIQLSMIAPKQAKLAIGNINSMINNATVKRFMARDPKAAQEFLSGIGVTGFGGKSAQARGFIGTPNIVEIGGQNYYSGLYQDADGSVSTKTVPFAEGAKLTTRLGETAEAETARAISEAAGKAGATETAKGGAARTQGLIDEAYISVGSLPTINRALTLLDDVDTGGITNRTLLASKKFFGVESADEGELSNLLGKSVLSQLRTTFGAAFTAKEGESLKQIEAGFGNNPATNRRLLNNAKRIVDVAVDRGIRAAKRAGQMDDVEELERLRAVTLTDEPVSQQPTSGRVRFDAEGNML